MRILIAEDELLERKAMRKFIEDNFSDMQVVGEAANGRKAIELAGTMEPDIIFMDIKMPGINGLEAIEGISQRHPSIKFILVSAYDSFDYAKQAMKFGIKEYILKPGKKVDIVRTILRVKKEILQERNSQREKLHLIEEQLITKLIHHPVQSEAAELQKNHYPTMLSGCFMVVKPGRRTDADSHTFRRYMDHPYILKVTDERITVCILATSKLEKAEILALARKIQLAFGEACFIGVGFPYSSLEDFPKSYHEALTACYHLAKEKKRNYGFVEEREDNKNEIIIRLLDEIAKGNEQRAVEVYSENQDNFTESDREEIYFKIKQLLEESHLSFSTGSISKLHSNTDWQTFITICSVNLKEYHRSRQHMEKAKTFIEENYQRGITLEEAAAYVDLSPNYFSNVFKQEYDQTFIDYVTQLRLERAKELIQTNIHSLKEISHLIGYKDPNYFSRVFKKYYHTSPKHFQQEIFKK